MRVNFDLQRPEFVQDESDDEIKMPYRDLIHMYNKQYSMVMAETKKFYSQCKNAISNTLSLNQIGMGFNVHFLLHKFLVLENSISLPFESSKCQKSWKESRGKYQLDFHDILSRMGKVVDDLLQFEIDIKLAYLGQQVKSSTSRKKLKKQIKQSISTPKTKFFDDASSVSNKYEAEMKKCPKNNEDDILRGILKKNMSPEKHKKNKVCQINRRPMKNLEYLLEKTDRLQKQIKEQRVKQEQIWNIFNEKRPSRLMGQGDQEKWEIHGFQNFGKVENGVQADENEGIDWQSDKKLYETFQTYYN